MDLVESRKVCIYNREKNGGSLGRCAGGVGMGEFKGKGKKGYRACRSLRNGIRGVNKGTKGCESGWREERGKDVKNIYICK